MMEQVKSDTKEQNTTRSWESVLSLTEIKIVSDIVSYFSFGLSGILIH